jgi:hypothetical protein
MENEEFLSKYSNVEEYSNDDDFEIIDHKPLFGTEEPPVKEGEQTEQTVPVDVISKLLAEKGIVDPTQIKFETEEGEEERVNFYDLPIEEQL